MNKNRFIACLFATLVALAGCEQRTEDIFEQSVSERLEASVQSINKQLISSEHGWILEYIPGPNRQYGGFYIGLKFSDKGEVLATTEMLYNPADWQKSLYVVGKDKSVSINFDVYNEAIHIYTTPDRMHAGGVSLGYEGDHEFVIAEVVSDDLIKVRGKKYGTEMIMRRATEPIDNFIKSVVEMRRKIYSRSSMDEQHQDALIGTLGGKEQIFMPGKSELNTYMLTTEDATRVYSYFVTPTGIRFIEPIEGVTELTWDDTKKHFVSDKGTLIAREDPNYAKFAAYLGQYKLSFDTRTYDVEFTDGGRNLYRIKGLPFDILATYNIAKDRFEIKPQQVATDGGNRIMLCVWDTVKRNLSWGSRNGFYSKLVPDSNPKQYQLVDNGEWSGFNINAFIMWQLDSSGTSKGSYEGYTNKGFNTRMIGPFTFTRK